MVVEEETVGYGHRVAEEKVHLHVAVSVQVHRVNCLVLGRNDGHVEIKASEAVAANVSAVGVQRTAGREHEYLVLNVPLYPGDGGAQGIGLLYEDRSGRVKLLIFGMHLGHRLLGQDEALGVMD